MFGKISGRSKWIVLTVLAFWDGRNGSKQSAEIAIVGRSTDKTCCFSAAAGSSTHKNNSNIYLVCHVQKYTLTFTSISFGTTDVNAPTANS